MEGTCLDEVVDQKKHSKTSEFTRGLIVTASTLGGFLLGADAVDISSITNTGLSLNTNCAIPLLTASFLGLSANYGINKWDSVKDTFTQRFQKIKKDINKLAFAGTLLCGLACSYTVESSSIPIPHVNPMGVQVAYSPARTLKRNLHVLEDYILSSPLESLPKLPNNYSEFKDFFKGNPEAVRFIPRRFQHSPETDFVCSYKDFIICKFPQKVRDKIVYCIFKDSSEYIVHDNKIIFQTMRDDELFDHPDLEKNSLTDFFITPNQLFCYRMSFDPKGKSKFTIIDENHSLCFGSPFEGDEVEYQVIPLGVHVQSGYVFVDYTKKSKGKTEFLRRDLKGNVYDRLDWPD